MSGLFITFEGGEGSGKSSQINLLGKFLESIGKKFELTREPGGTPLAEKLRYIVLTGDADKLDPITESLLYLGARADHWIRKIKPELDAGKIVISDRFHDSSIIYQGFCKGVSMDLLNSTFLAITNGRIPDRTYLIDIDPKIGIKRSMARKENNETRFEKMDISFHEDVRKNFLKLASGDKRFMVVDGSQSIDTISEIIKKDIIELFSLKN